MSLVPGPGWDQTGLGPTYSVRVRGDAVYLWGSGGLTENITLPSPLLLHVRNDLFGEPVQLGTESVSNAGRVRSPLGVLDHGQCVSIPIQSMSGVYALCDTETAVSCVIDVQQQ